MIYVVIALRPGDPVVSPRNKVLTNIVRAGLFTEGALALRSMTTSRPSRATWW